MAVLVLVVAMAFLGAFLSLYIDMMRLHRGFEPGGRLVTVIQTDGVGTSGVSLELIERMNEDMPALNGVAGIAPLLFVPMSVGPERESLTFAQVTEEWFPSTRPRMALGRGFVAEDYDQDAEPAIVISYPYWQEAYGGRTDVLGTMLDIRSSRFPKENESDEEGLVQFRIVGVISPELARTSTAEVHLWVPYERFARLYMDSIESIRASSGFWAFYRKSWQTPTTAVLSELNSRYLRAGPELQLRTGYRMDGIEGVAFDVEAHRQARNQLRMFLAGSVLLALVAAANVSLFLLARAPGRRRELAIRMSVGAPVRRIARQLATEAGLLVLIASVFGLWASIWLNVYLRDLIFLQGVEWRDVSLFDWRVLGLVAIAVTVLTLLVSLAPIQGIRKLGIAASSRQVAARASIVQRIAGTAQVAIACTLGAAAVAFAWFLATSTFGSSDYEIRNRHVVFAYLNSMPSSAEEVVVESNRRREAILSLPGVDDLAASTLYPSVNARPSVRAVPNPVNPSESVEIAVEQIDSRYIDLLGLTLLHGRGPADNEANVAVVNQTLARQFWGRDNVVGEVLPFASSVSQVLTEPGQQTGIIGVVRDLSFRHPLGDVPAIAFSTGPGGVLSSNFIVESSLSSADLSAAVQELIESGAMESNFGGVVSMGELRGQILAADRVRGLLTVTTAGLVVLLAGVGFYGTQRYLVSAGRREYAIRASMGAGPRALGRLVLQRGLLLGLPGLVLGVPLAVIVVVWLRDAYVSRAVSPVGVMLMVVAALTVLLLAASFGPSRQARHTQPAPLLRED